jgi:cysteine desulfurase
VGFAKNQEAAVREEAAEFAENRAREVVEHEASDAGRGADRRQGLEKVAADPLDAIRQSRRARGEVEADQLPVRQAGVDRLEQRTATGAQFRDQATGGRRRQATDDPAGIPHPRVDQREVTPAAHGVRVGRIEVVEDFGDDDALHGLQWVTDEVNPKPPPIPMSSGIHLDNNATTRIAPRVFEAMVPWLTEHQGNPSSLHRPGRKAAAAVEEARTRVAALAGCPPGAIVFTGCGTESITTAILSATASRPDKRHIVTTAVEHSATLRLCEALERGGHEITRVGVDSLGRLDPAWIDEAIRPDTALVTLLAANNETGVLFPVREIAAIAAKRGVLLHLDAVQALGKVPVDLRGAHFASFSAHKLHGPKGVGALFADPGTRFVPLLRGSQEGGRRGGTHNVASIVGFGEAAWAASDPFPADVAALRDRLERTLLEGVPRCGVNGDPSARLPNTTNMFFDGVDSGEALVLLDQRGVWCSAGSACASGSREPSHVLAAMGLGPKCAGSSLRFSLGRDTTPDEVDRAGAIIAEVVARIRSLGTCAVVGG